MGISMEEIMQHVALLDEAENFKPIAKKVLGVIESYAKELEEPLDKLSNKMRQSRVDSIEFYKSKKFTKQEAILLSLADSVALQEALKSYTKK